MRRTWALVLVVAVALACGACGAAPARIAVVGPSAATPSASLVTPAPPSGPTPLPSLGGGVCSNDVDALGSGATVDADPSGVTAAWLPGLNAQDCRAVLSTGTAGQARRLAHDIRHLQPFPSGAIACPMDDGADVQLVFAYSSQKYEQVVVALTGCAGVSGGGRLSAALSADLLPLAPANWRSYLDR